MGALTRFNADCWPAGPRVSEGNVAADPFTRQTTTYDSSSLRVGGRGSGVAWSGAELTGPERSQEYAVAKQYFSAFCDLN